MPAKPKAKPYRVLVGLNYPGQSGAEKRADPGDVVTDLPAQSIPWLVEDGYIEPVDGE